MRKYGYGGVALLLLIGLAPPHFRDAQSCDHPRQCQALADQRCDERTDDVGACPSAVEDEIEGTMLPTAMPDAKRASRFDAAAVSDA